MADSFIENILGVASLIGDDTNKVRSSSDIEEGVDGDFEDSLELPMKDSELLELRDEYESKWNGYGPNIKTRQNRNKSYVKGSQRNQTAQEDKVVPKNLLFEATATFVPEALAENPEPVVFSDDSEEGKMESSKLKTMLQYHADIFSLRRKLGVMVWHWSIYFLAVVKHGWDGKINDISTEIRKPQNFVLDPDGYIDEFGDFRGAFLGERIETTAKKLIDEFPSITEYITVKVNGKLGTKVIYTQWWTDEFTFSTYQEKVLEKSKNPFFNYGTEEKKDEEGTITQQATPGINHFAVPKIPYTFLSVFSLQEQPFDFTNLIEQNIANQDRINDRDDQISKNLASGNNAVKISGTSFTTETASQAVQTFYEEGFLLMPDGNMDGAQRLPASPLPSGILEAQESDQQALRSVYGTQGLVPNTNPNEAVRNNIMNENHDSSRIGGDVGDSLEIVAKNIFNWWAQLYCVFYDVDHYGAVMGNGQAVEYVNFMNTFFQRKFVISVSPNSMIPKDDVTKQNIANERWGNKSIDPIGYMKEINDPDPMKSAERLVMWTTNPAQYAMTFFPQIQPQQLPGQTGASPPTPDSSPSPEGAAANPDSLSQVPINNLAPVAT